MNEYFVIKIRILTWIVIIKNKIIYEGKMFYSITTSTSAIIVFQINSLKVLQFTQNETCNLLVQYFR